MSKIKNVWAFWFSTLHAKLCMTNVRIKIGFFCLRCVCCVCKSVGYYVSQALQISGCPSSLLLHNYASWIKMYYILICGHASLCLSCVIFVCKYIGIFSQQKYRQKYMSLLVYHLYSYTIYLNCLCAIIYYNNP